MTTAYPGALDNFTNPTAGSPLTNPSHAAQHSDANDAIEAVQAYLGVSSSTDPATITGRVKALEDGTAQFVTLTGDQNIAGVKVFENEVRFETAVYFDSVNGIEFGLIDMLDDPNSSTGKVMVVESDAGVRIAGPYITLDSGNPRITMPGAQLGSPLVVAGIDSFGLVSLGYGAPLQASYQITDTATANVVIKAAGAAVPSAWVELGLGVVLAQAAAAGTAELTFEMILSNPTTRTGTAEFGLRINGTDFARDITLQIPANFLQTVAMTIPLLNAYAIGDDVRMIARVTVQSNSAFALSMNASASDPAVMRFTVPGTSGGGAVNTSWGDINGTLSDQTDLQAALDGKLGVTAPAASVDDLNSANALKQWVGTQAQYDAIVTKDPNTFYNITDATTPGGGGGSVAWGSITGTLSSQADLQAALDGKPALNGAGATGTWPIDVSGQASSAANATLAATANIALTMDDTNSGSNKSIWCGTEAEYTALPTKDPNVIYFRTA